MQSGTNFDPAELSKFDGAAPRWWDPDGEFRPLHDLNPARLDYIDARAGIAGKRVLDVGCGGGLLSEGMARRGAQVTGIDLAPGSDRSRETACPRGRHRDGLPAGAGRNARRVGSRQLRPGDLPRNARARAGPGGDPGRASRASSGRAATSSARPSTAIPSRSRSRSSARNTSSACCRRARTSTRA